MRADPFFKQADLERMKQEASYTANEIRRSLRLKEVPDKANCSVDSIKSFYAGLSDKSIEEIQFELKVVEKGYNDTLDTTTQHWYSMAYNYIEEILINKKETNHE